MTVFEWLNEATARIRFQPDREAVRRELENHIGDLTDRYIAKGLSPEQAEAQAVSEMGSAREIAAELGRLHRPWWGWLWKCSQILLLFVSASLACLVLFSSQELIRDGLSNFRWYRYLTWEPHDYFEEDIRLESSTYVPGRQLIVDGNTITLAHIRRDTYDRGGYPMDILYLDLHIRLDTPGNPLSLTDAIIQVTDSTGTLYPATSPKGDQPEWRYHSGSSWLLWQTARIRIMYPPENIQWLEIAFGYGDYRRTMHIGLTEEVEP